MIVARIPLPLSQIVPAEEIPIVANPEHPKPANAAVVRVAYFDLKTINSTREENAKIDKKSIIILELRLPAKKLTIILPTKIPNQKMDTVIPAYLMSNALAALKKVGDQVAITVSLIQ